jgi:photosystem II stability/assembly factor-like uncharacterized protein
MKRLSTFILFVVSLQFAVAQQWIQLNPNPTGAGLSSVQLFSNNSGYIAGSGGAFLKFNGADWIPDYSFPFPEDISAMYFLSPTDGWVATDQGSIIHYDGSTWTMAFNNPDIFFNSIHMSGPDNGWAVGGYGHVVKFNGTSWEEQEVITDVTLWSVFCWDASHVWAGGNEELLFYNGTEWEAVVEGAPCSFIDFHFNSLTDGTAYTNQPLVYNFNGTTWTQAPLNDGGFDDVEFISASDIWAVDDLGSIWHSNGTAWELVEEEIIPNYGWFTGLDFSDATHGWAVGSSGAIYQYDGIEWTRYTEGFSNWLNEMDYANDHDVWTVGDAGFLYHYDGQTWDTVTSPTDLDYTCISIVSENDVWAGAYDYDGSKFVHYNGTEWTVFQSISAPYLQSISMINANLGWAVTGAGKIFRFDGTTWTEFTQMPAQNYLYTVSAVSENNVWAGGYCGNKLWHFDGTSWNPYVLTGASNDLQCGEFWFTSPTDGWAAARLKYTSPSPGYIFHYDGTNWSQVWEMDGTPIQSIQIVNDTLGWAVGDNNIIKYNGTSWEETQHNVGDGIQEVCFTDPETGWLCGYDGLFYQYNPNYIPVAIQEPGKNNGTIRLYPNPAEDMIGWRVNGSAAPEVVEIFSMQGTPVKREQTTNHSLPVDDLLPGLYLLRVTTENGEISTALFLKK